MSRPLRPAQRLETRFPSPARLAAACPSCGVAALTAFYEQEGIPVNSCLTVSGAAEARDYPRARLQLAHCAACGFVTNARFDAAAVEYSPRYEETQAFSGTFNAWARGLAERLVRDYDLVGKSVLEIGCGKGEFLVHMVETGAGRGVGIDPGYRPERTTSAAAERIEFVQDFYDERYAHLQADMVCCRHTAEHIAPVREFLTSIRRTIGDRKDTVVFFEVPDVLRVLREGAFWDVYHEHCSYFTPGSFARLFRAASFDVVELELDYDDQYVLLVARPAEGPTRPRLPLEDDLEATEEAVRAFPRACAAQIERWRRAIEEPTARGEGVVLWGSGSKAVAFLHTLGGAPEVERVVDINPHKHGHFMPGTGQRIVAPEELRTLQPKRVIAMNPIYREEIARDLARLGVDAELLTL